MIPISESKQIAYRLMSQTVLLLVCYAAAAFLMAIESLLAGAVRAGLAALLLDLALVTGLLAGGLYILADASPDQNLKRPRAVAVLSRWWTVLLVVSPLVMLTLGDSWRPVIDIAITGLGGVFVALALTGSASHTRITNTWAAGMTLSLLFRLIALAPAVTEIASGIRLHLGDTLAGLALAFWLMRRFSQVTQRWADEAIYTTAGLLTAAGIVLGMSPVLLLGALGLLLILICNMIFAATSYRALSDRNPTVTLSAHWTALAVILFLFGVGFLGGLQALDGIRAVSQGTYLATLPAYFASGGLLALILGGANQVGAELRGRNQRITGLMPFWLVMVGLLGGGLTLMVGGVVQAYLQNLLGLGPDVVHGLLIPLHLVWIGTQVALVFGMVFYALGFRARRPKGLD